MANKNQPNLKLPPQNLDAEKSLLGAILIDKDAIIKVGDVVDSADFYDPRHGTIYSAMLQLFDRRSPIDPVTLVNELEKSKKLTEIGGASYIAELTEAVLTAANIVEYANIIANKATLRRLIHAAATINELGFQEDKDISEILDEAESKLFSVGQNYLKENFVALKDILSETFDRIDEIHKTKGMIKGVETGFRDLDNLLGGMQPSDLIILAARPSMGKTAFALNIATNAAINNNLPVAIFSLEQSKDQIVDRILCSTAGVDLWKLRTGNLTDDDFPEIGRAMGVLSEAPIYIDDQPMATVMEVKTKSRRLQADGGLGLIIIDYLQLMEANNGFRGGSSDNRVQEVSQISRALKGLARELHVPVIALSQLSRAVEMRQPKIPQLADLRESGSIEQDADVVMFIYREDYYEPETERKNIADILVRKHRNGPVGNIELFFRKDQTKFANLERSKGPRSQEIE